MDKRLNFQLLSLCGLMAAVRATLLYFELGDNPFTSIPLEDAAASWQDAGHLANGNLISHSPYLSAPLYIWALGLLRSIGLGLSGVYLIQIIMWASAGYLLGLGAHLFFQGKLKAEKLAPATLMAVGFFLWLPDTWTSCSRILNSSLQLLLVTWLFLELCHFNRRRLGLALGLNALANPPFLLACLLVPLLLWSKHKKLAIQCLSISLLCIAPATIHNYAACGEFIPISGQAGVTFAHGNNSNADGLYQPIDGVSGERQRQNADAFHIATQATGESSWTATSNYFLSTGLNWWAENPGTAILNLGRKFLLFFTEYGYGDIYQTRLEDEAGLTNHPGPQLFGGLLLIPGLLGIIFLWRERKLKLELLLPLAISLITVLIFFYTPRYRIAALPSLVIFATWLFYSGKQRPAWISAGVIFPFIFQTDINDFRPTFFSKLGSLQFQQQDLASAANSYRISLQAGNVEAGPSLGHTLRLIGQHQQALVILQQAAEALPHSAHAQRTYAVALASKGEFQQAKQFFETAIALEPADWESPSGLGNVMAALGKPDEAEKWYRHALDLNPNFASAWLNLGVLLENTDPQQAAKAFRAAMGLEPQLVPAVLSLASLLATSPDPSVRNGHEALEILAGFGDPNNFDAGLLELSAAAHAANGNWETAIEQQSRAIEHFGIAAKSGDPDAKYALEQAHSALGRYRAHLLRD